MSTCRARLRNTSNALTYRMSGEQIRLQVPPKLFGIALVRRSRLTFMLLQHYDRKHCDIIMIFKFPHLNWRTFSSLLRLTTSWTLDYLTSLHMLRSFSVSSFEKIINERWYVIKKNKLAKNADVVYQILMVYRTEISDEECTETS